MSTFENWKLKVETIFMSHIPKLPNSPKLPKWPEFSNLPALSNMFKHRRGQTLRFSDLGSETWKCTKLTTNAMFDSCFSCFYFRFSQLEIVHWRLTIETEIHKHCQHYRNHEKAKEQRLPKAYFQFSMSCFQFQVSKVQQTLNTNSGVFPRPTNAQETHNAGSLRLVFILSLCHVENWNLNM